MDVELVQLEPPTRGGLLGPGLEVHDADRAQADLVDGVAQELSDLGGLHGGMRLGQREQVTHPHAHAHALDVPDEVFGG